MGQETAPKDLLDRVGRIEDDLRTLRTNKRAEIVASVGAALQEFEGLTSGTLYPFTETFVTAIGPKLCTFDDGSLVLPAAGADYYDLWVISAVHTLVTTDSGPSVVRFNAATADSSHSVQTPTTSDGAKLVVTLAAFVLVTDSGPYPIVNSAGVLDMDGGEPGLFVEYDATINLTAICAGTFMEPSFSVGGGGDPG